MRPLKLGRQIGHAFKMAGRTIGSYALLSITIVLSFSFLLGYMLYIDSYLYNENKEIFSRRRGDIVVSTFDINDAKTELFIDKLNDYAQTISYVAYYGHFGEMVSQYASDDIEMAHDSFSISNVSAYFIPDLAWLDGLQLLPGISGTDVIWLDETRGEFVLNSDEVVLSEKMYRAMGFDKQKEPVYVMSTEMGPELRLRVAGYIEAEETIDYSEGSWLNTPTMFLSTKLIEEADLLNKQIWGGDRWETFGFGVISRSYVIIYSGIPENVAMLAESMDFAYINAVYEQQKEALTHIRNEKGNKAIIACALLLLLGINLYSSFTNALNDRKFEIGVKRAIGASAGSIVRQFLYESIIVMVVNTVISIALIADVFIVYKYIYERIPDINGNYNTWTIYISPHSAAIFGLCSVTLTVVFSLIFAYKSTRVEIVQYLKAE